MLITDISNLLPFFKKEETIKFANESTPGRTGSC